MRYHLSWRTISFWQKILHFSTHELVPKRLERPYFYGNWGVFQARFYCSSTRFYCSYVWISMFGIYFTSNHIVTSEWPVLNPFLDKRCLAKLQQVVYNREHLAPQIHSMNNRFHSEAKLPWSYDYPLANHIATNKSFANREMPLFSHLYPSLGYLRKIFLPRSLKYSLLCTGEQRGER